MKSMDFYTESPFVKETSIASSCFLSGRSNTLQNMYMLLSLKKILFPIVVGHSMNQPKLNFTWHIATLSKLVEEVSVKG